MMVGSGRSLLPVLLRAAIVVGVVLGCVLASAVAALGAPVLTEVPGSPFSVGSNPYSVAFSPSGGLLATANSCASLSCEESAGTVSVFSVNSATGALSQVPGSPFPDSQGSRSVAFSPSGGLLATANAGEQSTVSVFLVNSATGALSQVPGSPFPTGSDPVSLAFSPSGGQLVIANRNDDTVSVFSVNSATGALSQVPGSPFPTGSLPDSVAFSPSGGLLATANYYDHTVSVFSVNSATGALSQVPGSPFPTGDGPESVAFSPSGGLLAIGNGADYPGAVSVFSVNSGTGALSQVPGSPFVTGDIPELAFSPSGLLASATIGRHVYVFTVNSGTGALSQVPGSPFLIDPGGADSVAFSPSGGLLATANAGGNTVSMFSVVVVAPSLTGAPRLTGPTKFGDILTCSTGTWTGNPTGYSYSWYRNGTLLAGFSGSTYTLGTLDEGTMFTCVVTATNANGSASAPSNAVNIPIPVVQHCPGATGSMTGTTIGQITLGMTQSRARYLYRQHSNHGKQYEDFFCLTPIGIRVGYASPILLNNLPKQVQFRLRGRVVWASTSNPYYSLDGVRAGESIATAAQVLGTEPPFHIGLNYWYLARKATYTAVLKVRGTVVQELGIADNALTKTRKTQNVLMHSFY